MASKIIVSDIDPNNLFAMFLYPFAYSKRLKETRFKQNWNLSHFEYCCLMMNWNGEGDPKQWIIQHMKHFVGPKYQRGNFSVFPAGTVMLAAPTGGNVVLTNHTFASTDTSNLVTSRAVFQSDGTLVHRDDGVDADVQAGEWADNEPSTIGANFEVRYTSVSKTGTAYNNPAEAADIWITIDAERTWGHRIVAKSSPASHSSSAIFELGADGAESADDSATLTISADN